MKQLTILGPCCYYSEMQSIQIWIQTINIIINILNTINQSVNKKN